jgi:plastocyanin domain-containing protein
LVCPVSQIVPVELMPDRTGEYPFSCQLGMLRGRLVVE